MNDKELVIHIIHRYERMLAERSPFESDWRDIRDLVRPISGGYNRITNQWITYKIPNMYDGTAPDALEQLACALHSFLTNPAEPWFELGIEGEARIYDIDTVAWLQLVTEIIFQVYSMPTVNLAGALFEVYMDEGSYGMSVLNQEWDPRAKMITFRALPVGDIFIMENSRGLVDTVYYRHTWTKRQIMQEFGSLPKLVSEIKDEDRRIEVLQAVFPRSDKVQYGGFAGSKPVASVWVCTTTKELITVSGYDSMPHHCVRWAKMTGEVYGRSPATKCLPDIKMLNSMEKTLLKAGQKVVDPPMVFENDQFLLPIRTNPGAIIYKEPGAEFPQPLQTHANLPWGLEHANQKREFIRKCFYADWIRLGKENTEMTATEVQDRRDEKLRLIAPMLGRQQTELLGPMIARTYMLLDQHNMIPPAPPQMRGQKLRVNYVSPAARAQLGSRAVVMAQYLQDLIPVSQVDPGVLDAIDFDKYAAALARYRGVPMDIMRSPDELAQVRQQKQAAQAAQQAAQVAEPASQAYKNLSEAQKNGMPPIPGLT